MIRTVLIGAIILGVCGGAYWLYQGKSDPVALAQTNPAAGASATTAGQAGKPTEFWAKRCNPDGEKYCEVFQRLSLKDSKQPLIEFAVGYPKNLETAQAAIVLPLGVILSEGVVLKVDDGAPAKANFRTCVTGGCFIVMNMPESFVSSMKTGKKMTVSFLDGTGKQINVEMSLEGFGQRLSDVGA